MKPSVVQDSKDGVVLTVHVQPRASHTACAGIHGAALKIRVAAPPAEGAANEALIRFLAQKLSIPATFVRIQSGTGGRHKRVVIRGVTAEGVSACLVREGP